MGVTRRLIVALLVALPLAAVAAAAAAPVRQRWVAESTIRLAPVPGTQFSDRAGNTETDIRTEAQLLVSDAVLARAAAGLDRPVQALRPRVSVLTVPATELVVVSVRSGRRADAARAAAAVSAAFLTEREARGEAALARARLLAANEQAATGQRLSAAARQPETHVLLPTLLDRLRLAARTSAEPRPYPGQVVAAAVLPEPSRVVQAAAGALALTLSGALTWFAAPVVARSVRRRTGWGR